MRTCLAVFKKRRRNLPISPTSSSRRFWETFPALACLICSTTPVSYTHLISLFIVGSPVMAEVWKWCLIGLVAYALRFLLYGISTSLSHFSAYTLSLIHISTSKPFGVFSNYPEWYAHSEYDKLNTCEFHVAIF